jgi:NADH:ubiquinone oxidoreductase subunit C
MLPAQLNPAPKVRKNRFKCSKPTEQEITKLYEAREQEREARRLLEDARKRIGQFIEQVYNRKRLHSALRYLTPEEFEQLSQARGIDIGMRSLAFPVTPPCVRVRTRRFVRIKRRECNATEEAPSFRNKWLAWHRREPVFG